MSFSTSDIENDDLSKLMEMAYGDDFEGDSEGDKDSNLDDGYGDDFEDEKNEKEEDVDVDDGDLGNYGNDFEDSGLGDDYVDGNDDGEEEDMYGDDFDCDSPIKELDKGNDLMFDIDKLDNFVEAKKRSLSIDAQQSAELKRKLREEEEEKEKEIGNLKPELKRNNTDKMIEIAGSMLREEPECVKSMGAATQAEETMTTPTKQASPKAASQEKTRERRVDSEEGQKEDDSGAATQAEETMTTPTKQASPKAASARSMRLDTVENAELKKSLQKFHQEKTRERRVDSEEGRKEDDSGAATQARERRVDDSNRVKTSPPPQVTADRDVVNQLSQLRMKELLRKRMNASDHEVSKANKQITRLNFLLSKLRAALDYNNNFNPTHEESYSYGKLDAHGKLMKPPRSRPYSAPPKKKKMSKKKRAALQRASDAARSRPTSATANARNNNNVIEGESVVSVLVAGDYGKTLRLTSNVRGVVKDLRPASTPIRRKIREREMERTSTQNEEVIVGRIRPRSASAIRGDRGRKVQTKNKLRPQSARVRR